MVSTTEQQGELRSGTLPDSVRDDVGKRLRRLEGQIRGLQRLLDEDAECREIVHQVSAAQAALDRVGFRLIAAGMRLCINDPDSGVTPDELEKLFLKLS